MDLRTLAFQKSRKGEVTEYEQSEDERLREEGFEFTKRMRAEDLPPPSTPINSRPTLKLIKAMFMVAPLDSERKSLTRSFTEYLAIDCNVNFVADYIHCEICFVAIDKQGTNASFSSSSGTKGVTFIHNKKYNSDNYKTVWDICLTKQRFDLVYKEACKMVESRYGYDQTAIFCFLCYSCVPERYKTHRHTCATACAQLLALIGIGDDNFRDWLRDDRSITVDDLHESLRAAHESHPGMMVSKEIHSITPGYIPESMKLIKK